MKNTNSIPILSWQTLTQLTESITLNLIMNTFSIPLGFSVQEHVYYIIVMIFNVLFAAPILRYFSLW